MNADMFPTMDRAPIHLSEAVDFTIGTVRVRPSLREVIVGSDARTIEPRVMQVLVAIAQADGRVVSRDELMHRCWGGRVVGEDAMNRCIAKVRAVLKPGAVTGLRLETVPRVGYRLVDAAKLRRFTIANVKLLRTSLYGSVLVVIVATMMTLAVEWALVHR